MTSNIRKAALLLTLSAAIPCLFAEAPFTIIVVDPPGEGFNDPTPAEPGAGNTGTTIGEQRVIAFQYAAAIWSSRLESPVPIRIRASFRADLPCDDKHAILGINSTLQAFYWNTTNTTDPRFIPNIWYPAALANRLAGEVLDPDFEELEISLSSKVGQPDCLPNKRWYYGLDSQAAPNQEDVVEILLHEIAHGLGFGPTIHQSDFSRFRGKGDVFAQYLLDTTTGKSWNEMTDEERVVSATNTRNVVWNGINTRKDAPKVLQSGNPTLHIAEPPSIAGNYEVATAAFGARITPTAVTGQLVAALDEANSDGPSATDACSPLLNASEIAGRIALVDRGTCSFVQKALNIQAAGAIGIVVVDNVSGTYPYGLGGTDATLTIPTVSITLASGNTLKTQLMAFQTVTADLVVDASLLAGADLQGRPRLYNPNPVKDGSSISHWDPAATPNLLMEPDVPSDVPHGVEPPDDLTLSVLRDLGWFNDFDGVPDGIDQCPGSDRGTNIMIQGCDTGVANTTFVTGCRISDYFKPCDGSASCIADVSKQMRQWGVIDREDRKKIRACVVPSQP